jgi:hypothetical protein
MPKTLRFTIIYIPPGAGKLRPARPSARGGPRNNEAKTEHNYRMLGKAIARRQLCLERKSKTYDPETCFQQSQ